MNREVQPVLVDVADEDLHRVGDHVLVGRRVGACRPDHLPQRAEGVVDQGQPQLLHVVEVPVEGGGHDAGLARDLAQAEPGEALILQQP